MPNENERDSSSVIPTNDKGENKAKRSRNRSRNLMLIQQLQYLPAQYSSLDDMLKLVDEVGASEYAGILHDKDHGVAPHIHILMHFKSARELRPTEKKYISNRNISRNGTMTTSVTATCI